jgi:hypothetical protein
MTKEQAVNALSNLVNQVALSHQDRLSFHAAIQLLASNNTEDSNNVEYSTDVTKTE